MKNRLGVLTVSFLLFFSCSHNKPGFVEANGEDTLKTLIGIKSESALWTHEIEDKALSSDLSYINGISSGVRLSPTVLSASSVGESKIYPTLKNFGSLNSESLKTESRNLVRGFCKSISDDLYSGVDYLEGDSLFTFIFFIDSLEKAFEGENIKSNKNLFKDFYIGASFLSGDEVQVPVRLVKGKTNVDISLFINEKINKITQIKIDCIEDSSGGV